MDAILSGQPEPQTYFARMKRDNKRGVPVLGALPQPRKLTLTELARLAERPGIAGEDESRVAVVDTRLDRSAFVAKHLPGALYAPMNKSFNTVVGSLVVDETAPLVLIAEEEHVEEAVRDLVRIGYDNVEAYATPETLERYFEEGGAFATIDEVSMRDVARLRKEDYVAVVDVRFASEYAAGHVPGALNASYTRLPQYASERLPEDKVLVVHCASGARSAAAAAWLAREGYDVKYVNGFFDSYREVGEVEEGPYAEPALA